MWLTALGLGASIIVGKSATKKVRLDERDFILLMPNSIPATHWASTRETGERTQPGGTQINQFGHQNLIEMIQSEWEDKTYTCLAKCLHLFI